MQLLTFLLIKVLIRSGASSFFLQPGWRERGGRRVFSFFFMSLPV